MLRFSGSVVFGERQRPESNNDVQERCTSRLCVADRRNHASPSTVARTSRIYCSANKSRIKGRIVTEKIHTPPLSQANVVAPIALHSVEQKLATFRHL